jgi:DNA polymerase I-like protein with 3'-5' exonuclease and polymerase domains
LQVDEASELIAQFHAKVPFLKGTIAAVQKRIEYPASGGSIRTLLGRKCRFPLWEPMAWGLNKALPYEEAAAKYGTQIKRAMTFRGLNKLMQGSAADQTKKAMVELHKAGFTMMLSVHDEIALSVDTKEEAESAAEIMRTCVSLEVPSKVDVEVGDTWGSAE